MAGQVDEVRHAAAEFVEAVRSEDEAWVRQILTSENAGEVAVEVARMALHARSCAAANDERDRQLRNLEADYRTAGIANRKLIAERSALRAKVRELRGMKGL